MKTRLLNCLYASIISLCIPTFASAATIWEASYADYLGDFNTGVAQCGIFPAIAACPDIKYFKKDDGADWLDPANQDYMTDNVTLTRADFRGLFNIAQEPGFVPPVTTSPSPVDTEWAFGSVADLNTNLNPSGTVFSDDFSTWGDTNFFLGPAAAIDVNMIVHLITDDIYLDWKLLSWTSGDSDPCQNDDLCGGYSMIRANGATANSAIVNSSLSAVPVPAAVWLFASGLLGLIGVARRKAA